MKSNPSKVLPMCASVVRDCSLEAFRVPERSGCSQSMLPALPPRSCRTCLIKRIKIGLTENTAGVSNASGVLFERLAHIELAQRETPFGVVVAGANR